MKWDLRTFDYNLGCDTDVSDHHGVNAFGWWHFDPDLPWGRWSFSYVLDSEEKLFKNRRKRGLEP